jgi:hypothetical protein
MASMAGDNFRWSPAMAGNSGPLDNIKIATARSSKK